MQRLIPPSTVQTRAEHLPLFNLSILRQIETRALEQAEAREASLMQAAGEAVAKLAHACYPHVQNILIIAGKGNNGGDAIVAARHLQQWGKQVHVVWLGNTEQCSADTREAVTAARSSGITLYPYTSESFQNALKQGTSLIIDGLLGIGIDINRHLGAVNTEIISVINQYPAPVIAVDIPSGLICDTGALHTKAISADHTITFLTAKPGIFTAHGREYCGQIWLDTLGVQDHPFPPACMLYYPSSLAYHQQRPHDTHKGSYGDVCIIGGAPGMTGAALLAARAASKAGAGRTYVGLLENSASLQLDVTHAELMFREIEQLPFQKSTLVCGCGGGDHIVPWLSKILSESSKLVLDADALNAIAESLPLQQKLKARYASGQETILTPHPLEAARLLKSSAVNIQNNRVYFAQTLADTFACTCVLKGSGTITASPEHLPIINSTGNAALATAGSGDVLAGWIGGRWSANATFCQHSLHEFAAQCVWEHGQTADLWIQQGQKGVLSASDLVCRIR